MSPREMGGKSVAEGDGREGKQGKRNGKSLRRLVRKSKRAKKEREKPPQASERRNVGRRRGEGSHLEEGNFRPKE